MTTGPAHPRVVALSGGVGGARLVDGLAQLLPPDRFSVVVNTGDDFVHWGLHIAPDVDTVMYTLAGVAHEQRGWGLAEETFGALDMVARYGGADWFRLGDRDLGTHLVRTQWLADGLRLTEVTARLCRGLGVAHRVLPMSDGARPTLIETREQGTLSFQDWLVRRRGRPAVVSVRFGGHTEAAATPEVLEVLGAADVVIIGPSNPYVSIDPILALPGVCEAVRRARVVVVSPIVRGRAIKGPLAEMIETLAGRPPSAAAVAAHYASRQVLAEGDLMIVEDGDQGEITDLPVRPAQTVMRSRGDRRRLAASVLEQARELP